MRRGTTQYLYGNLAQPFQVTASRSPDNVLTVYYYDDYGALYALERDGVRYYVGSDHLGTPKVITDNNGNILRQMEFDSWGVKTSDTNPGFDLPVGFAGGIPDDATGLVRFGFRDYEPGTGRWAAKDPIFFDGGQANLYAYVGNDPVNYSDLTGMDRVTNVLSVLSWGFNRYGLASGAWQAKTVGVALAVTNIVYSGYLVSQSEMSRQEYIGLVATEIANMYGGLIGGAGSLSESEAVRVATDIVDKLIGIATGTYTAVTGAQGVAGSVCPRNR